MVFSIPNFCTIVGEVRVAVVHVFVCSCGSRFPRNQSQLCAIGQVDCHDEAPTYRSNNEIIGRLENVEPMPMLCELTTVLQYIVAIAESMALPPSSITFLRHGAFLTLKIS